MTIGELIQRVNFILNAGVQTDESPISNRLIYNKLKGFRAMIVRQMYNQNQFISSYFYQTLKGIKLKATTFNGMQLMVTDKVLPKPCTSNFGEAIQYVHLASMKLDIINPNRAKYLIEGSRYTGTKMCCFFHDDKIYVTNTILARSIDVSAIFEDVIEAYLFNEPENVTDYMGLNFHIGDGIVDNLVKLSIQDIYGGMQQQQQQQEQAEQRQPQEEESR